MGYCTLDDLLAAAPEDALVQLTDDEGLGAMNQTRIDEAIASADAAIDTYLGGRYSVPLDPVPAVVQTCSTDIAIYRLYKRRVEDVPPSRETAMRDAVKLLEKIALGRIGLATTVTTVTPGDFVSGAVVHEEE